MGLSSSLRIGLTGGIGSGKSTCASWWQQMGATVIDADATARELTGPQGAALPQLLEEFGPALVDANSGVRREAMRAAVFQAPELRKKLEAVLHPLIRNAMLARASASCGWVVLDIPLLVESGTWPLSVDKVLVIDCDADVQLSRVAARPGWTRAQAQRVMDQQATRKCRRAAADACIDNSQIGLTQLHAELATLAAHWGFLQGAVKESVP